MPDQTTRDAVLRYLDGLAKDTMVMPLELSKKVALSKEQVDTYLAMAPRCDEEPEIVVSSEGAIRIHPRLKGTLSGSKSRMAVVASRIVRWLSNALNVAVMAIAAIWRFKYGLLVVAGIVVVLIGMTTYVTDWSDPVLRLIRAAGALTSALAGIAALLTDGAFTKRQPPPTGRWKDFPFAKYRATPWGATLLAVILLAPLVQFVGDWFKDANDIRTTADVRSEIEKTVRDETGRLGRSQDAVIAQQTTLAAQTSEVEKGIERTLYPFKDIAWAYEVRVDLGHPWLRQYAQALRTKAKEIFGKNPNFGNGLAPHSSTTQGAGYPATYLFRRSGQRSRLLIHVDSPLMPTGKGLGPILGYDVGVDVFKKPPTVGQLLRGDFRSDDYSVSLLPPFSGDFYAMRKASHDSFDENSRTFELIYIPEMDNQQGSDECFVDYYWHALKPFDAITQRAKVSIIGLPDLCNTLYSIRLYNYSGDKAPPVTLEALRMRVGDHELTLERKDLTAASTQGAIALYTKAMPARFDELLKLFETVRSGEDRESLLGHDGQLVPGHTR